MFAMIQISFSLFFYFSIVPKHISSKDKFPPKGGFMLIICWNVVFLSNMI